MDIYYVYALIDPVTNLPFYIGKGKNGRMYDHLKNYKNTQNNKKCNKISEIRNKGHEPIAIILFSDLSENEAYLIEEDLIKKLGRENIDNAGILTNNKIHAWPPTMTEDVKSKISDSRKGIKFTTEHKAKLSAAKLGKSWEENFGLETAQVMRENAAKPKGKMSDSIRNKISNAKKGMDAPHPWNIESRDKVSSKMTGVKKSEEAKKNMKIAAKIKKVCPYCGFVGSGPSMKRWHFNNCKKSI